MWLPFIKHQKNNNYAQVLYDFLLLSSFWGLLKEDFSKDPIIHQENFDKQRVHWGYFLGFNSYDFKFDYLTVGQDIVVNTTTGFSVGLVGNLRLNDYFDVRFEPGFCYTT